MKFIWESIFEEYCNGLVIGYMIWYCVGCEYLYEFLEVWINVSLFVISYIINSFFLGKKYDLCIVGFIVVGIGYYE